jgi:hypothetical protein
VTSHKIHQRERVRRSRILRKKRVLVYVVDLVLLYCVHVLSDQTIKDSKGKLLTVVDKKDTFFEAFIKGNTYVTFRQPPKS